MRTLASFIITSLDGFYEGPNGELDWSNLDADFNDFAVRRLDEPDTLGFGRATYEHMAAHGRELVRDQRCPRFHPSLPSRHAAGRHHEVAVYVERIPNGGPGPNWSQRERELLQAASTRSHRTQLYPGLNIPYPPDATVAVAKA